MNLFNKTNKAKVYLIVSVNNLNCSSGLFYKGLMTNAQIEANNKLDLEYSTFKELLNKINTREYDLVLIQISNKVDFMSRPKKFDTYKEAIKQLELVTKLKYEDIVKEKGDKFFEIQTIMKNKEYTSHKDSDVTVMYYRG